MAKKSLILDNGDGRVTFSNTSSVSIDDGVGNNMSASYMTASSLSLSGVGVGQVKILSASNGTFSSAFPNGTVNGGAIAFNGTSWVTSSLLVQDYSGSAYGDLSGSYESGVQVKNISNVNSGTLPVAFGGTGKSLAASQAYILKVSSSAGQTPVISALSASSGSILTTFAGVWATIPPGYPDVRFYTSGSSGNTFTWTKPAGARFARVILQGAGGGGGGSTWNVLTNGSGGGAGAFTDITIDVSTITSALVTCGIGGSGGISAFYASGTPATGNGTSGTSSTFIATNINLYASGGLGGGKSNSNNAGTGGAGGAAMPISTGGYSKNGDSGWSAGTAGANNARYVYGISGGGAAGGWQGEGVSIPIINSTSFGYQITSDGIDISTINFSNGTRGDNLSITRAGYGAGGGAISAGLHAQTAGKSVNGGHGYVIVISW